MRADDYLDPDAELADQDRAVPSTVRDCTDWIPNGAKMWITNGTLAAVAIVWAQTDDGIRGFVVPTGTPGFAAHEIHRKLSLRASITAELTLEDVRLPAEAVLPDVR